MQPLGMQISPSDDTRAGDVSSRPVEAGDEPASDGREWTELRTGPKFARAVRSLVSLHPPFDSLQGDAPRYHALRGLPPLVVKREARSFRAAYVSSSRARSSEQWKGCVASSNGNLFQWFRDMSFRHATIAQSAGTVFRGTLFSCDAALTPFFARGRSDVVFREGAQRRRFSRAGAAKGGK
jgi:hypothetical protein